MRTIHKVQFAIQDRQTIMVPKVCTLLSCQVQKGMGSMWYLVDMKQATQDTEVVLRIFGTGHHVPDTGLKFVASLQINDFVWHVFCEESDGK